MMREGGEVVLCEGKSVSGGGSLLILDIVFYHSTTHHSDGGSLTKGRRTTRWMIVALFVASQDSGV
jgi:hypothetical protein